MNELKKELMKHIEIIEKEQIPKVKNDRYCLKFHLMPPTGWLNDPNGLCQFHGENHVFFQYCPFDATGGLKVWGHYISKDWIHWEYKGTPFVPDYPYDCHGIYSGCAWIEDSKMHLFYTGNVKYDGQYDYILEGRDANVIHAISKDGIQFEEKECLLKKEDYPKEYTCHIRDPKVWKENEIYYMVLGGRKKEEKGAVLLYQSKDLKQWSWVQELTTKETFGYMWECPDLFRLKGQTILSVSPQGLERGTYQYQNIYQSGYFLVEGDYCSDYQLSEFKEWDMGFDFYAPQTFQDEKGRRILIGWMGLPDMEEEYKNPTVESGWQHTLTLPRQLTIQEKTILQYPIEEINLLREECIEIEDGIPVSIENGIFDLELLEVQDTSCSIQIQNGLLFEYKNQEFSMKFINEIGMGRKERKAHIKELKSVRILADRSAIEVYINHGEYVFSTRFYPLEENRTILVDCKNSRKLLWTMKEMSVIL